MEMMKADPSLMMVPLTQTPSPFFLMKYTFLLQWLPNAERRHGVARHPKGGENPYEPLKQIILEDSILILKEETIVPENIWKYTTMVQVLHVIHSTLFGLSTSPLQTARTSAMAPRENSTKTTEKRGRRAGRNSSSPVNLIGEDIGAPKEVAEVAPAVHESTWSVSFPSRRIDASWSVEGGTEASKRPGTTPRNRVQ